MSWKTWAQNARLQGRGGGNSSPKREALGNQATVGKGGGTQGGGGKEPQLEFGEKVANGSGG